MVNQAENWVKVTYFLEHCIQDVTLYAHMKFHDCGCYTPLETGLNAHPDKKSNVNPTDLQICHYIHVHLRNTDYHKIKHKVNVWSMKQNSEVRATYFLQPPYSTHITFYPHMRFHVCACLSSLETDLNA